MLNILNDYKERGLLYSQIHPTLPLTIWNYTEKVQYESLWDEVTLSARGLVTDGNGRVVARPFSKFFNIEEVKVKLFMLLVVHSHPTRLSGWLIGEVNTISRISS